MTLKPHKLISSSLSATLLVATCHLATYATSRIIGLASLATIEICV